MKLFAESVAVVRDPRRALVAGFVSAAVLGAASPASAIMLGFRDDFQGVGTQWTGGSQTGLVTSGGPNGATDGYLRMVADGSGPSGKLTVHNATPEWLGDYNSAGVTGIQMDLRNFSTQPLTIRVALKLFSGPSSSGFCTSTAKAYILPADGAWHRTNFLLADSDMVGVNSPPISLQTALAGGIDGFHELRILHSTTPVVNGVNISATMGVDNITAVPTPGAAGLMLLGTGVLLSRRVRVR